VNYQESLVTWLCLQNGIKALIVEDYAAEKNYTMLEAKKQLKARYVGFNPYFIKSERSKK